MSRSNDSVAPAADWSDRPSAAAEHKLSELERQEEAKAKATTTCRDCGAWIFFARAYNGKKIPLDVKPYKGGGRTLLVAPGDVLEAHLTRNIELGENLSYGLHKCPGRVGDPTVSSTGPVVLPELERSPDSSLTRPCPTCFGINSDDCETCDGEGRVAAEAKRQIFDHIRKQAAQQGREQ